MLTHRTSCKRGRRARKTGDGLAGQSTLIRKCHFEQLEDRRMLAALPTIMIDDVQQMEGVSGTTDFVFTVTRSGKTNSPSTISYTTADGSAEQGEDYQLTSGTLEFASKEISKTFAVPVVGDATVEDDETFYVDLTIDDNGQFGVSRGVGTIANDDAGPVLPALAIDDVQLNESDSGLTALVFTVTRSGDLSQSSTVNYSTTDGTATISDNDYEATSGTLLFGMHEDMKTITVPVVGDATVESDETFYVDMTIIDNGQFGISRGVGTIVNDDTEPVLPELVIDDMQLVERDSGTSSMVFTVTRSGDLSQSSTVNYSTADGTATIGDNDYLATGGTLSFGVNEAAKTISVDVLGDTLRDGSEVFYVDLSEPGNAVIPVSRGTGLILGDDGGVAPPPGLVSWWTADGTAADLMSRNDAQLLDGTMFAPGMVGQAFDFDGVDDRVQLPDSESLKLIESLSIEGWVMIRAFPADRSMILFRGDDRGGLDPYSLQVLSDGRAMFSVSAGASGTTSLFSNVERNQFVHLAGTLDDATGTMSLFLNGQLVATSITDVRPFGDLDADAQPGVGIGNVGGAPDTSYNFPFDGLIDELSLYNRALTNEEVQRIYQTGSEGKVKMTVARTNPDLGSVVAMAPTQFVVDFTFPVVPDSVQVEDLEVNHRTAATREIVDADTVTFTFTDSPVTSQGLQSIYMPEGAVTSANDVLGIPEYRGEFRYDATQLTVSQTAPTAGSDLLLEELDAPATAVLSMAGMNGGNGAWPVLYGADAVSSRGLHVVVDEDTLLDTERSHTSEQAAYVVFEETGVITSFLETGLVTGITDEWFTVPLSGSYSSAVVVATPNYDITHAPLVTRIKNVTADSFDLRVQTADGLNGSISPVSVHYLVAEEGDYTAALDGITMEAVKLDGAEAPSITDGSGSWQGASQLYQNTYSTPVVVGQVMSADDSAFSVFWARGTDSISPPTSDSLFVGKHVGEDPTPIRSPETIGYIVIEGGKRAVGGLEYLAGVGTDAVLGMDDGPVTYQLNQTSLEVDFNEAFDASSVGTDDLFLSSGSVMGAEVVDSDTARYTLVGVTPVLTVDIGPRSVLDQYGNSMLPFSARYHILPTKFYVVDSNDTYDWTFEYTADGTSMVSESWSVRHWPIEQWTWPAGATADASGTTVWVLYTRPNKVAMFDNDGQPLGLWDADGAFETGGTGIATDGIDIWIADAAKNRVLRYADAASRTSGSQRPSSNFRLASRDASGLTTDGTTIWVVDNQEDRVYKYSTEGVLHDDWSLHSANSVPAGITIDPTGASDSVWVVDSGTDAIYEYQRDTGEFRGSFALDTTAGNSEPTGIADPPPAAPISREPGDVSMLRTRVTGIARAELPWLLTETQPITTQHDEVKRTTIANDVAGETDSLHDKWVLPLMPVDYVDPPFLSREAIEVRVLNDIAEEEAELLDEDLLALIAVDQK